MAAEKEILDALIDLLATISPEGGSAVDIDVDTPIVELSFEPEDVEVTFVRIAERYGVRPETIEPPASTAPQNAVFPSAIILSGLRDMALFLAPAKKRLERLTSGHPPDTLRSLAKSIAAKRYVPSGLPPLPLIAQGNWIATCVKYALIAAAVLYLPWFLFDPACAPLCSGYYDPGFSGGLWRLLWGYEGRAALLAMIIVGMNLPALIWLARSKA